MAESSGPWFDNHCHLGHRGRDDSAPDVDEVLAAARQAGVVGCVTVGTDLESSLAALAFARELDGVWATAGVHPHDAVGGIDGIAELLAAHGGNEIVAVGECGLDHYYEHSPATDQRAAFAAQIDLANEYALPLVIHTRDAWDETFEILDGCGVPERTVFHCFTGGPSEAERCLERGAMLSISGIVTFPSAADLRSAVAITPLDALMVETDSPYLAPVPNRGKPNQPAWVGHVGAKLSEVLDLDVSDVAAATTANAARFYGVTTAGVA